MPEPYKLTTAEKSVLEAEYNRCVKDPSEVDPRILEEMYALKVAMIVFDFEIGCYKNSDITVEERIQLTPHIVVEEDGIIVV